MYLAFKTILVATDVGPAASLALEYARTLANRFHATIHLVHIVKEPFPIGVEGDVPEVTSFRESLLQSAHNQMRTLLAATPGATGEVLAGQPAARIIESAAGHNADLVVMGTHGRRGVKGLLLGSVAAQVVRAAPCPVLTIRDSAPATRGDGDATHAAGTADARARV
jgi:nucleotide-binding universal stress UspA family protein